MKNVLEYEQFVNKEITFFKRVNCLIFLFIKTFYHAFEAVSICADSSSEKCSFSMILTLLHGKLLILTGTEQLHHLMSNTDIST